MNNLRTSTWRKAVVVGALPLALGALTACADDDPDVVEDVDIEDTATEQETVTDEDTVVDQETETETESS